MKLASILDRVMQRYVTEWGDDSKETVVLLHPAGGTGHVWTPHAEHLEDEYHIVAPDLPAHGIHPNPEFEFDRAVEDVGLILEEVGSAVVAGHSQGGYVGMRVAAEHGNAVDGVLLGGAAYNLRKPKMLAIGGVQYPLSYVLDMISNSDHLSEWIVEKLAEGNDEKQEPPDDEDTYRSLHGTAESIRAGMFQPTWPYIEAYDGPVMIAHGKEELAPDHAEELAERVDGQLEWYEGGHQAPMSNTTEFAGIIRDFLDEIYIESV